MNHRIRCPILSIPVVVLLATVPLWGQNGAVQGRVLDEEGKPLPGVLVVIEGVATGMVWDDIKTDKKGEYFNMNMRPGQYKIVFKRAGRVVCGVGPVRVHGGEYWDKNTVNVDLKRDVITVLDPSTGRNAEAPCTAKTAASAKQKEADTEAMKAQAGFDRGVALNREGKFAEALAELEPVLVKDPSQWAVHAQLGVAYAGLKRDDEAVAAYKKAIELYPSDPALYNNLGQIYIRQKKVDEARKLFEAAALLNPDEAGTFYFNLATTFINAGDMKAAIEPLRKAVEVDPGRSDAHFYLGLTLFSTAESKIEGGQSKLIAPAGTRESLEKYLELDPNGRYAGDARAILEQLGATVATTTRVKKN